MDKKETLDIFTLIMTGGSIKGAYQVGQLLELSDPAYSDFISLNVKKIYGTSVGSLNGAFVCDRMGRGKSFREAVELLADFYVEEANSTDRLIKFRGALKLFYQLITSNFDGVFSTSPLREMLEQEVSASYLRSSDAELVTTDVNLYTGKIDYVSAKKSKHTLDRIMASTSIPWMMPPIHIKGEPYQDGGLRDTAPTKLVNNNKGKDIICLSTHPINLKKKEFNEGNISQYSERIYEISRNAVIKDDIKALEGADKLILAPSRKLEVSITNFSRSDVIDLMQEGKKDARATLHEYFGIEEATA